MINILNGKRKALGSLQRAQPGLSGEGLQGYVGLGGSPDRWLDWVVVRPRM